MTVDVPLTECVVACRVMEEPVNDSWLTSTLWRGWAWVKAMVWSPARGEVRFTGERVMSSKVNLLLTSIYKLMNK